jgi:hypothetical protein
VESLILAVGLVKKVAGRRAVAVARAKAGDSPAAVKVAGREAEPFYHAFNVSFLQLTRRIKINFSKPSREDK